MKRAARVFVFIDLFLSVAAIVAAIIFKDEIVNFYAPLYGADVAFYIFVAIITKGTLGILVPFFTFVSLALPRKGFSIFCGILLLLQGSLISGILTLCVPDYEFEM